MPALQETRAIVTLAPAKPTGLADLGAPVAADTEVKKGRLHEFDQPFADGRIGRRFQDLRVVAIKTAEGGIVSAKVFLQFETFGDNIAAPNEDGVFGVALYAGERALVGRKERLYLPYASFWYANRFVFDVSTECFDQADQLEFVVAPVEVRMVLAETGAAS